jgi:hypothetical protein
MATLVSTWPNGTLLPAIRSTMASGDEGLLCVAFANRKGVALLDDELSGLAERNGCRMLLTSVFGGGRDGITAPAVLRLQRAGVRVRVLNPGGGTYHPKMYLSRSGQRVAGLVGSANLTSGLLSNIETGVVLDVADAVAARDAWDLGEALWAHPAARDWDQAIDEVGPEPMPPSLVERLMAAIPAGSVVATLSTGAANRVAAVTAEGVWVETDRSTASGAGPQLVEGWMVDLAWTALQSAGELTNDHLLNVLHVHRSSFVCAALAELPEVDVVDRRPIKLALRR